MGKFATENENNGELIANKSLAHIRQYGLLGLMNDAPVNIRYLLNEKVSFKDKNIFTNQKGHIKRNEYVATFFPATAPNIIADNISYCEKLLSNYINSQELIDTQINDTFVLAQDYHEMWIWIVDYAQSMYKLLLTTLDIKANGVWCASVGEELKKFEIRNLNLEFTATQDMKIKWNINSLKQALDLTFALITTRDNNMFNICKHCKNAFIAKNPKSEYCSYSCKNQANVYKSGNKNK